MTSSAAGHINFLHSNFKVKVVYGIAWLKAKGPFVARLGVSRIRQQGGSFLSVHAREKVSGEFPGCISSHLVAERRPLGFLM